MYVMEFRQLLGFIGYGLLVNQTDTCHLTQCPSVILAWTIGQ